MHSKLYILLVALLVLFIIPVSATPLYPHVGYDNGFRNYVPHAGTTANKTEWIIQVSNAGDGYYITVGSDGTIYLLGQKYVSIGNTSYANISLYAIKDGKVKWERYFGALDAEASNLIMSSDETLYAIIVFYYDNIIKVYAFNKDGVSKWNQSIPSAYAESLTSMAYLSLVVNGDLMIAPYEENKIYVIGSDGSLKNTITISGVVGIGSISASSDTIYLSAYDSNYNPWIYALTLNGEIKWTYQFPAGEITLTSIYIAYPPVVAPDGSIYFESRTSKDLYLCALNPDGSLKWKKTVTGSYLESIVISSDTIYVTIHEGYLLAFNFDGSLKWNYTFEGNPLLPLVVPALDSNGIIYLPTYSSSSIPSYIYAINPNGTLKWRYKNPYNIDFGITYGGYHPSYVVVGSSLIAVDEAGHIYYFPSPPPPPQPSPPPPPPQPSPKPKEAPVSIVPTSPLSVVVEYLPFLLIALAVLIIFLSASHRS